MVTKKEPNDAPKDAPAKLGKITNKWMESNQSSTQYAVDTLFSDKRTRVPFGIASETATLNSDKDNPIARNIVACSVLESKRNLGK